MRKILTLIMLTFTFLSCTKENNEDALLNENAANSLQNESFSEEPEAINYLTYLENRYTETGIDFAIVDTENITVLEEGDYTMMKIQLEALSMKDVYLAFGTETGNIKYFAEFNWNEATVESVNFVDDEVDSFYTELEENFFFEIRDAENPIQSIVSHGGGSRFWGWQCGGTWTTPDGSPYRTCCYKVGFFNVKKTCAPFTAGGLPGSNPKITAP